MDVVPVSTVCMNVSDNSLHVRRPVIAPLDPDAPWAIGMCSGDLGDCPPALSVQALFVVFTQYDC